MNSPVFILPIRGTYEGKVAPIWVLRTGDVVFESIVKERIIPKQTVDVPSNFVDRTSLRIKQLGRRKTKLIDFASVLKFANNGKMPGQKAKSSIKSYEEFRLCITDIHLSYYQSIVIYENSLSPQQNNYGKVFQAGQVVGHMPVRGIEMLNEA